MFYASCVTGASPNTQMRDDLNTIYEHTYLDMPTDWGLHKYITYTEY